MKRNLFFSMIGAAVFSAALSMSAQAAQDCAAPDITWNPDAAGSPALSGTTCGHESGITTVCGSNFNAPAAAYVALINVTAAGSFTTITFANTSGGAFTLATYFVAQATGCNTNGTCTTSGSTATTAKHANLGPGAYYMIVTGADFDNAGACGTFTATANGTLPVSLQSFTVDG